jgi:elongation factor G
VENTAVQPLLGGACAYLASPSERQVVAHDTAQLAGSLQVELVPASAAPLVALAFKLEEGRFGQLTYLQVYQGSLIHGRSGKRNKVPQISLDAQQRDGGASLWVWERACAEDLS